MTKRKTFRWTLFTLGISFLFFTYSAAQSWLYLGQKPPGMQPERFPPYSLLSNTDWKWHGSPVLSPDGTEMFFAKYYHANPKLELAYMRMENNSWIGPEIPAFANMEYYENCPVFSPTGDTLYFRSTRPGGGIFYTVRIGQNWIEPVTLNIPFPPGSFLGWQFAFASDGSVYFEIWENGQVDIYFSKFLNGNYQPPGPLPSPLNTEYYEWGTFIDPEGNFMMFTSNRPGGYGFNDIYLSIYNGDETWSNPINLGSIINSDFEDCYPLITFDSQYFFFGTQKSGDLGLNPYWVDAQVIYDLVTDVKGTENIVNIPGKFELKQNYPNPFNPSTTIEFDLPKTSEVTLKIYNILGEEVEKLVSDRLSAGSYSYEWDASNLASGVYLYRLEAGEFQDVEKMVLIK